MLQKTQFVISAQKSEWLPHMLNKLIRYTTTTSKFKSKKGHFSFYHSHKQNNAMQQPRNHHRTHCPNTHKKLPAITQKKKRPKTKNNNNNHNKNIIGDSSTQQTQKKHRTKRVKREAREKKGINPNQDHTAGKTPQHLQK